MCYKITTEKSSLKKKIVEQKKDVKKKRRNYYVYQKQRIKIHLRQFCVFLKKKIFAVLIHYISATALLLQYKAFSRVGRVVVGEGSRLRAAAVVVSLLFRESVKERR